MYQTYELLKDRKSYPEADAIPMSDYMCSEESSQGFKMQIFAKTLKGVTLALEVQPHSKIRDIKEKIHKLEPSFAPATLRILHGDAQLKDELTLEYYNIMKNSTIHVVPADS